jgi:hypothetical protein
MSMPTTIIINTHTTQYIEIPRIVQYIQITFKNEIHLQQYRNPSRQKTMQIAQIECIKHKENLRPQTMCVLNFQITKNDFKSHNFKLYHVH